MNINRNLPALAVARDVDDSSFCRRLPDTGAAYAWRAPHGFATTRTPR